jgi:hypothetical protein
MTCRSSLRRRHAVVAFISFLAVAATLPSMADADRPGGGVVVAVVEPRDAGSGLDYSVSIGGRRLESTKAVMDGLREAAGAKLMLLMRADVRIGRVSEVVSMASKNGYWGDAISLFVFDVKREGVVVIPGYRYADYTEDPALLARLASSGGGRE